MSKTRDWSSERSKDIKSRVCVTTLQTLRLVKKEASTANSIWRWPSIVVVLVTYISYRDDRIT